MTDTLEEAFPSSEIPFDTIWIAMNAGNVRRLKRMRIQHFLNTILNFSSNEIVKNSYRSVKAPSSEKGKEIVKNFQRFLTG